MDSFKSKGKKGLISKTWERCKSFSGGIGRKDSAASGNHHPMKSKSWPPRGQKCSSRVAPEGCFAIYAGPQKQRFVIKTEYVNHPLFKKLLEEAESEYGYRSDGPLVLPCQVDHFIKVLREMGSHDMWAGRLLTIPSCTPIPIFHE